MPSTCLDVVGQVGAGDGIAPVEAVGQQVIFRNHVVGHAERMQDQRAGKAGAILAGGAVDHQRRAVVQQMREQASESAACSAGHSCGRNRASPRPRDPSTAACRPRRWRAAPPPPWVRPAANARRSRPRRTAPRCVPRAPRKSNALRTPRPRTTCDVVIGQMAEMVGAEDLPPADAAAVAGRDSRRDRGNCWRRRG